MKPLSLASVVLLGSIPWAAAAEPIPLGAEQAVNTYLPGRQMLPDVATVLPEGFIVVWASEDQDGDRMGVFGRRLSPDGSPRGSEFAVNGTTIAWQNTPRIAPGGGGGFTVVWEHSTGDGADHGVFARLFDGTGTPRGPELQVPDGVAALQTRPDISSDAQGGFVVTWVELDDFLDPAEIRARRFDSAGAALGQEILVSAEPAGLLHSPAVAVEETGGFVITWSRPTYAGLYNAIYGRRFSPEGAPRGGEFRAGAMGPGRPYGDYYPRADLASDGRFIVVWERRDQGVTALVMGELFDSAGSSVGGEFTVSTPSGEARAPDVTLLGDGGFVVAWAEFPYVLTQRFDGAGAPVVPVVQMDSLPANRHEEPALSADPNGGFVAVWTKRDTSFERDVVARPFTTACTGPARDLLPEILPGNRLLLTWTDAAGADDHVVFEDGDPAGSFTLESGSEASGSSGLTVQLPSGNRFYLVAGSRASCGLGPLR